MTVRGAMDQTIKPGARKMASSGYRTPNISKSKGKSYSRSYGKGGKGSRVSKKTAVPGAKVKGHMGMKSDHRPSAGGGTSRAGNKFGGAQKAKGRGTGTMGAGVPPRGGSRKIHV